jgi:hypothetical protein
LTSFDQIALYHEARCAAAEAARGSGGGGGGGGAAAAGTHGGKEGCARRERRRGGGRRGGGGGGGGDGGGGRVSFADSLEELCGGAALGAAYRIGDATNMVPAGGRGGAAGARASGV